jgi:predicted AlkP superfamily pyrophosphatase or phosphodiesterase
MIRFVTIAILASLLFISGCTPDNPKPRTPLILISIDGLKPSDVEKTDTPTLDFLRERGTLAESMIPVFPTSTFPNHYSLVTGLYTNSTGVISNTMYDPEMERWFRLSDRSAVSDGRWYGGEPIWVTAEKNDIRTATMFWPGSEAEIMGVRPTRWYNYDGSIPYEARIDSVMHWLTLEDETRPDFVTLYFSKVDSQGHSYGAGSDSVLTAITYVDQILGNLIERLEEAGIWPNVDILLTSDHGMIDLSDNKLLFLDDLIDLDDVNVINWSPVVMIQPVEGKREEIFEILKANEENYQVYYKEDVPERLNFGQHPRVPDIVMIADLGWTISNKSFYERRGILAGTHGYDNIHPEMHAYFMAVGASFEQGKIIPPFSSVNIYELMAYLLGVEPAPNDGDLEVLKPILRND